MTDAPRCPCEICHGKGWLRSWAAGKSIIQTCWRCKGAGYRVAKLNAANDDCPGPENAARCSNMSCRRNGCFGRTPDAIEAAKEK